MGDGDSKETVQKPYKGGKQWLCFDVANWHFDGVVNVANVANDS